MPKPGRLFFFAAAWTAPFLLGTKGIACIFPSTTPYSGQTTTGFTFKWNSTCPGGTLYFTQIYPDSSYSTALLFQNVFSSSVTYGGLTPNTRYFIQVTTTSAVTSALIRDNTATLAALPFGQNPQFTNVSSSGFTVHWSSGFPGVGPFNPPYTSYIVRLSDGLFATNFISSAVVTGLQYSFSGLEASHLYFITPSAVNLLGAVSEGLGFSTTTLPNAAGTDQTIQDPGGTAVITVPAGTFPTDFVVQFNSDPSAQPLGNAALPTLLAQALDKLKTLDGDPRRAPLPGTLFEIQPQTPSGSPLTGSPPRPFTVTIHFQSSGGWATLSDGTRVKVKTLALYRLNERDGLWVKLPGSRVDENAGTVSTETDVLGVFAIIGKMDTSLSDVFAYPVPFDSSKNALITFSNLPETADIRIFTTEGKLIRSHSKTGAAGQWTWDGKNEAGRPLSPGVYVYTVESPTDKMRGKLVILK